MADTLMRDNETLHAALQQASGPRVEVSFSRETAELVAKLLDARAHGNKVLLMSPDDEISPTDAAPLLGVSRPQVRKFMDEGRLEFRKVGTHFRIKVSSIKAFTEVEKKRSLDGMAALAEFQNSVGLTE